MDDQQPFSGGAFLWRFAGMSAVDDPSRITKSKAVGALFGLTPKKYQSGEKDFCQHSRYRQASDDLGLTVLGELRPIA
jgi:hypothetical protein